MKPDASWRYHCHSRKGMRRCLWVAARITRQTWHSPLTFHPQSSIGVHQVARWDAWDGFSSRSHWRRTDLQTLSLLRFSLKQKRSILSLVSPRLSEYFLAFVCSCWIVWYEVFRGGKTSYDPPGLTTESTWMSWLFGNDQSNYTCKSRNILEWGQREEQKGRRLMNMNWLPWRLSCPYIANREVEIARLRLAKSGDYVIGRRHPPWTRYLVSLYL